MTRHTLVLFSLLTVAVAAAQEQRIEIRQGGPPDRPPFPVPGIGRNIGPPEPMPKGTATLAGTVVSADGGRPLRRASVRLERATGGAPRRTITDDRGNFEFRELPAGEFTLRANKPGYLESTYGQKRPGSGRPGTAISLADGGRADKLVVPVLRGGVLTGMVVDDLGEPVFGATVRALRSAMRGGARTLVGAATGTTDDRGMYRLPSLPAGDYIVVVTPRDDSADGRTIALPGDGSFAPGEGLFTPALRVGAQPASIDTAPTSGYAPVFYPGTTLGSVASRVALAAGEEKSALDVTLELVALGTVAGTVAGEPRAVATTTVYLVDANTGLPGLAARTARPDAAGRFTFAGVVPGQYRLLAKSGNTTTILSDGDDRMMVMAFESSVQDGPEDGARAPVPPMWASTTVTVDGRSTATATLLLQAGTSVSGQVRFVGAANTPADVSSMSVVLNTVGGDGLITGSAIGQIDSEGRFTIADVLPGTYRVSSPGAPGAWRLRSFEAGGQDALDFLLEVKPNEPLAGVVATYSDRSAELTGTLQDVSGAPTSDYTIILFAADARYWTPQSRRILSTRPATDGRYAFRGVPPGAYRVVALEDVEPEAWFDPEFLRQVAPGAIDVALGDGDRRSQSLRIGR